MAQVSAINKWQTSSDVDHLNTTVPRCSLCMCSHVSICVELLCQKFFSLLTASFSTPECEGFLFITSGSIIEIVHTMNVLT